MSHTHENEDGLSRLRALPWSLMTEEKRYTHHTVFRKRYRNGFYRISVGNWELDKLNGKIHPQFMPQGGYRWAE